MGKLLEEYVENVEVDDNLYKAMYDDSQRELTESAILKMLNNDSKKNIRYTPSSSFNVPWRK